MTPDDPVPPPIWPDERHRVLLLAVAVEGSFIGGAYFVGWMTDTPPLGSWTWSVVGVLEGVLATLPLLGLLYVVLRWPVGPLRRIKEFSERVLRPLLRSCTVIDLLGLSLLAGLGEEMLFRAALQGMLLHWMSVWVAVLVSGVLFGLLHAVTPTYALLAGAIGVYLGLVWYWTDNLLVVTVVHALYDFLALLYLTRGRPHL